MNKFVEIQKKKENNFKEKRISTIDQTKVEIKSNLVSEWKKQIPKTIQKESTPKL